MYVFNVYKRGDRGLPVRKQCHPFYYIIVVTTYFSTLYITVQTVVLYRTVHRKHTPVLNGSDATRGSCMAHSSVSNASSCQSRRVTDGVKV